MYPSGFFPSRCEEKSFCHSTNYHALQATFRCVVVVFVPSESVSAQTYVHVPDWKIPLTKKGFKDGQIAGEKIKEYIGDKPLFIYTSPYLRTKQVRVRNMLCRFVSCSRHMVRWDRMVLDWK